MPAPPPPRSRARRLRPRRPRPPGDAAAGPRRSHADVGVADSRAGGAPRPAIRAPGTLPCSQVNADPSPSGPTCAPPARSTSARPAPPCGASGCSASGWCWWPSWPPPRSSTAAAPPFTFRLGQRPARQVRAILELRRVNEFRTNNAREDAAAKVPPSMLNDPAPIKDLADRLDDLVEAVPRAVDADALREVVGAAWTPDAATLELLKSAADTPAKRAQLHRRIGRAFEPLVRYGILGPDILPRQEEGGRYLRVRSLGQGDDEAVQVAREMVLPGHIAKPDGPIAREFAAAFVTPKLGQALFGLIAPKLAGVPTLRYEEQVTSHARKLAYAQVEDKYDTYRKGDVLVDQDQEIIEEHLTLLRLEHRTANGPGGLGGSGPARRLGRGPRGRTLRPHRLLHPPPRAADRPELAPDRHPQRAGRRRHRRRPPPGAPAVGRRGDPGGPGGDDPGRRLQSPLRPDGHLRPEPADQHGPGGRDRPVPGAHGGDGRRRPDAE